MDVVSGSDLNIQAESGDQTGTKKRWERHDNLMLSGNTALKCSPDLPLECHKLLNYNYFLIYGVDEF